MRGRFASFRGAGRVFMAFLLLFAALAAALWGSDWRGDTAVRPLFPGADMGMVLLDIPTRQAAVIYHVPERGVYVLAVDKGSPAALADIRPGDCILRVNGREILSASEVTEALQKLAAGEEAELTVKRGLDSVTLFVGADWAMEQMRMPLAGPAAFLYTGGEVGI